MSTQPEPMKPDEILFITSTARTAPLKNMQHARTLEFLCQKLEAHFAPKEGTGAGDAALPIPNGDGVQSRRRSQRKAGSKTKPGG